MQFEWKSHDGTAEGHVSIQASAARDRWQTSISASTLLQLRLADRRQEDHERTSARGMRGGVRTVG